MKQLCNVVMLATEKAENCIAKYFNNKLSWTNQLLTKDYRQSVGITCYHLYITSNEEIKEDDWFYDKTLNTINQYLIKDYSEQSIRLRENKTIFKIIATTDKSLGFKDTISIPQRKGLTNHYPTFKSLPQIPESFVKAYIESNGTITEVMVEYYDKAEKNNNNEWCKEIKLRPDNTIIISQARTYTEQQLLAFACWYSGMEESKVKRQLDKWNQDKL